MIFYGMNINLFSLIVTYKKEIVYGEMVECYYTVEDDKHIITAKTKDKLNAVIELS